MKKKKKVSTQKAVGQLMTVGGLSVLFGYLFGHRAVYIYLLAILVINGIMLGIEADKK